MRAFLKFFRRDRFVPTLIESYYDQDQFEDMCDREVWKVIARIRRQKALNPFRQWCYEALGYVKLIWRLFCGRHRIAPTQVHSSSNQASGAGAGTGSSFSIANPATAVAGFATTTGTSTGASTGINTGPLFEDAGIKAGEVTAYRCWVLFPDGLLHSCSESHFIWQPGIIAQGRSDLFGQGIHAFKSVLLMAQYGVNSLISKPIVTGTVELWGDVFEHERGYRAQYAAIKSIDDSPDYDADALRKLYLPIQKKNKKPRREKN